MALYKVDSDTADLTKVAGGTLYADLPIGSWIKNDMATIPSGFLKVGDTISQSECPELYAKYGSIVPYKADKSELSEYETFTITTSNKEIDYDGTLIVNFNPSSSNQLMSGQVFVNNVSMGYVSSENGQQQSITVEVKKGDNVRYNGSNAGTVTGKITYYKKSLIVKAKQTPVPADFMSAVEDYVKHVTKNGRSGFSSATASKWEIIEFGDNFALCIGLNTSTVTLNALKSVNFTLPDGYTCIGVISANAFATGNTSWVTATSHPYSSDGSANIGVTTYINAGTYSAGQIREILIATKN